MLASIMLAHPPFPPGHPPGRAPPRAPVSRKPNRKQKFLRLRLRLRATIGRRARIILFDYPARRRTAPAGAQHAPATETTAAAAPYMVLGGYCRNSRNRK
jgi:hypothetical protein